MTNITERLFDIEITCEKCFYEPNSHSFHILSENSEEVYFYTCHVKTKKDEGFVKHMSVEIQKIKNKNWVWILDGELFEFKHLFCPKIGLKINNFLTTNLCSKLQNIIIVNQNIPFKMMLFSIWRYIPNNIRKNIIIDTNKTFSELLKIDDKLDILKSKLAY